MVLKWYDIPSHRSAAPWKTAFLDDVTSMEGQEFVFSSVRESQVRNDQFEGSCAFSPRARFCAFRSFWAELPNNPGNSAPRNETNFASEMPTYTTDVRTGKISELFPHSSQFGLNDYGSASGGGGPCEAVWWARASMRQWRVRGRAFVVGPDIESGNHGASMVREALLSRMHATKPGDKKSWSWKRELTAHFGNLSPGMRGRFVAPPPGQPVNLPYDHEKLKVGQEIHDLHDPVARKHFRVVVIVPDEVEMLDMHDPRTARRHFYTFDPDTGAWSHRECWP